MTVYVDDLVDYVLPKRSPWRGAACHMMGDQEDLAELHAMAKQIGMNRAWFQDSKATPHYDLSASFRAKAVAAGAVEVSQEDMLLRCRRVMGRLVGLHEYPADEVSLVKVGHSGYGSHIPYATARCPACHHRKRVGWRGGFRQCWLLMCSCGHTAYIKEKVDAASTVPGSE